MEIAVAILGTLVVCLLYDKFRTPKQEKDLRTEDEIRREKELSDHWDGIFNYTTEQAYRKVTHG